LSTIEGVLKKHFEGSEQVSEYSDEQLFKLDHAIRVLEESQLALENRSEEEREELTVLAAVRLKAYLTRFKRSESRADLHQVILSVELLQRSLEVASQKAQDLDQLRERLELQQWIRLNLDPATLRRMAARLQ
jgi:hypothetical protein